MLLEIGDFKDRVQNKMDALVTDLQYITGRYGEEEEKAWRVSLERIVTAFSNPSFDPLHLYFGSKGYLSLEYQLPAASSWCDLVLLGAHNGKPSAIIIELKNWQTRSDRPGEVEGLMERRGEQVLHPSEQVKGYTEYCRRFHSAVYEYNAYVNGCVLFTADFFINAYRQTPNDKLSINYPCFTLSPDDTNVVIPRYFRERLTGSDEKFAKAFESGKYVQNRGFVSQIGKQILNPQESPFELIDNQRRAFAICKANVEFAVFGNQSGPKKTVIVIKGPPGSGKSVVAAKLWASLVANEQLPEGSVVFTTTSSSQNSNWAYLFERVSKDTGAKGVVKKATGYTPISTHQQGQLKEQYGENLFSLADKWRDNLSIIRNLGVPFNEGSNDADYLVSIVDEAHALINPEHKAGRGQYGFATILGPQAYHIIRASTVSIFLLDEAQSFRDRENTTINDIQTWGRELGANVIETISLEGAQFRCAGSKEYVDWLESLLEGESAEYNRRLAQAWYSQTLETYSSPNTSQEVLMVADNPNIDFRKSLGCVETSKLEFMIFNNPLELEAALNVKIEHGNTARLLASYARKWKTKRVLVPHDLPGELQDFHEAYDEEGVTKYWDKPWNYVPNGSDYTPFVQARPGSRMHEDQLCEVGCPYAVRGFDFDYIGILWLKDLVWRDDRWEVNPNTVFETGVSSTAIRAKKENDPNGFETQKLLKSVMQSYRILLTRGMKGVYVWFEDEGTRKYVESSIRSH